MAGGTDSKTGQRQWIYTASIKGRFQRLHRWSGLVLNLLLFATPWIEVGGHPIAQLDLVARRMYLLGGVYTPRDTIFLVLMLLGAAFTLFFVTSLYGRLWCGYACPQTVFLEEFIRPLERFWEGDRGARMALDKGPLSASARARKLGKHLSFALVALLVSMTSISYFSGAVPLWTGAAGWTAYAFVAAIGGALYFDFAWFREQFCNYLCPYARFQGALTDDYSVVIEYDRERGEPRGKPRKAPKAAAPAASPGPQLAQLDLSTGHIGVARVEATGALPTLPEAPGALGGAPAAAAAGGSCIDCNKCVAVCPAGIDIRDGYQLECINCARCVDACTGVMDKLGHESLVRYTTVAAHEHRGHKWLRPRTVGYAGILTALATAFLVLATNRHSVEATVNRAPGTLFQVDADGWTRNTYLLNISNNLGADGAIPVTVALEGLDGAELIVPPIEVKSASAVNVPLVVRVPPAAELPRTAPVMIHVKTPQDEVIVHTTFKSGQTLALEG